MKAALAGLVDDGALALDVLPEVPIERSRDGSHGDYATPVWVDGVRQAVARDSLFRVSSTAPRRRIFPRVPGKEGECREHGARFQAVDLRWGCADLPA